MSEHDIDVQHHASDLYAEEQELEKNVRDLVGCLAPRDIGVVHAMAVSLRDGSYNRAKPTALGGELIPPGGIKHVFKQVELKDEKDNRCKNCPGCPRKNRT